MTAISVSERLLEMAAFYTPLALTVTNLLSFLNQFYHMAFSQSKRFGSKLTVYQEKPTGPLRCSEPAGYCSYSHSIDGGCFALFFAVFRSIYLSCVAVFLHSLHRFQVA